MGISVVGGSGSTGKSQKFALFNSSSTWTAPTSANYDGVVKAFLVAAGGGGGGGAAGAVSTSNSQGMPGGPSGGGGGGGQVIEDVTVAIPSGTTVAVTVGAGGTGGQTVTTPVTINYFLNPSFETNTTGWSSVSGMTGFTRSTTFNNGAPQMPRGCAAAAYLYYSANANTHSFKYDSGNSAFTVDSGTSGYQVRAAMSASSTSASFTYTTSVEWYANATLIRTDSLTTGGADSTNGTGWRWQDSYLGNTSNPIPTNATRFVLNVSITSSTTWQWGWDSFTLLPNDFDSYASLSQGNTSYIDGSASFSGTAESPVLWAGTAHASVTKLRRGAGGAVNPGSSVFGGSAGGGGARGGNSSIGSYAIAYGGGGATGGGSHYYIYSGSWGGSDYTLWNFRGDSNTRFGGNGGGSGGSGNNGQSPTNNQGGGGGGAGGFGGLAVSGTYGLNFTGSEASASSSSTFFVTQQGGYAYKNIYGAGGMTGTSGGQAPANNLSTTGFENPATASNPPSNPLSTAAAGGGRGFSTRPNSGGAGGAGGNGTSATSPGSGGGGGGGGGSSTSVSQNSGTYAMPGNGGNGGNGANGLVILSWWE
jgi:hypothetical protein